MEPVILDIRSKEEFSRGHLCGANHIETPLPPLSDKQLNKLYVTLFNLNIEKDTPIAVYCKKGVRSGIATNMLRDIGFKNVTDLGGITNQPLKKVYDKHHCM